MKAVLYGSIGWRHPGGLVQVTEWAKRFGWQALDARGLSLHVPGDVQKRINAFGYDMLCPRQIRPSARLDLLHRMQAAGTLLLGIYCSSSVNLAGEVGDSYRELFKEYLQLGADLGVEWIRPINNTTRAFDGSEMSHQEAYDRTVNGLREVAQRAADLDVGLLLENNENTVPDSAAALKRLRDDLGDICRVGLVYDPVNAYFMGDDPVAGLKELPGEIDILHLKNVRRQETHRWDFMPRGDYSYEWVGLADGDIDWPSLIAAAVADGFDGPLVYEYVNPFKGMPTKYWDTLPEPDEAADREGKFIRDIIAANG